MPTTSPVYDDLPNCPQLADEAGLVKAATVDSMRKKRTRLVVDLTGTPSKQGKKEGHHWYGMAGWLPRGKPSAPPKNPVDLKSAFQTGKRPKNPSRCSR